MIMATLTQPPAKSARTKSRSGCVGCRLRHKKCDEEKPTCAACNRNGLLCAWPHADNREHVALLKRTNLTHRKEKPHSKVKVESPREVETLEDCVFSQNQHSSDPSQSSSTNDSNLLDSEYQIKAMSVLSCIPRFMDPQALFSNALLRQPVSRKLLDHYLHRTHKIIAICQGNRNPFLRELIPMAMSNQLVLNSLLAFSGIHFADLAGRSADVDTWQHYGQALQGQKYGLTLLSRGDVDFVVPLLTAAMILCIAESFRGNSGEIAIHHLRGARALLQEALKLPSSRLNVETRSFLMERYTYTMILAHITMGVSSDDWVLHDAALLFPLMKSDSNATSGFVSGCVHELFQLIPQVTLLSRLRQNEELNPTQETIAKYHELHGIIECWDLSSQDVTYVLCGQLYQHALLVYLRSSFEGCGAFGHEYCAPVQDSFDAFVPFLQSISLDSPLSTTLCWPLAIFGSCAKETGHRQIIRDRLGSLSSMYAAQSVRDTSKLLDIMWSRDSLPANPLSLELIMKHENMTVLFL